MADTFAELVGPDLDAALRERGIVAPTEVQRRVIPGALEGKDIIAVSGTGTGKTLSYLLPVIARVDMSIKAPQAIIVTPTHELASQVASVAGYLCGKLGNGLEAALIIGGASIGRQLERLKAKPRIIVGSAGRILELIKMKKLTAHYVKTIVLDEADRLLSDMNFGVVCDLIGCTLRDRQLLFAAASVTEESMERARSIAKTPELIDCGASMPDKLTHLLFIAEKRDKFECLRKLIHGASVEKGLVFMTLPGDIDNLVKRLNYHGVKACALLGAAHKNERRRALEEFRNGRVTLLVASDLAARGLDIADLTHVINMEVPESAEIYLHRAGRTGRMGMGGTVVTIAEKNETRYLQKLEKHFNIVFELREMRHGRITS